MQVSKVIKAHGLTQADVAARMGIGCQTLRASISKGNFTLSTLRGIADAIGCSVVEFFADEMEGGLVGSAAPCITCPNCGKRISITASVAE